MSVVDAVIGGAFTGVQVGLATGELRKGLAAGIGAAIPGYDLALLVRNLTKSGTRPSPQVFAVLEATKVSPHDAFTFVEAVQRDTGNARVVLGEVLGEVVQQATGKPIPRLAKPSTSWMTCYEAAEIKSNPDRWDKLTGKAFKQWRAIFDKRGTKGLIDWFNGFGRSQRHLLQMVACGG